MPINPNQGSTGGGSVVILTGTHLADATTVRFGTKSATITANTDTSVSVLAPSGAGVVDTRVSTPGGTSNPVPFYYIPRPSSSTCHRRPDPWRAAPPSPSPGAGSPPPRPWRSARRS